MLPVTRLGANLALAEGEATDSNADVVVSARVLFRNDWRWARTATLSCIGAVTNVATIGTVTLYDTIAAAALGQIQFTTATLTRTTLAITLPTVSHMCELRINCNGAVGVDYFQLAMAELVLA